MRNLKFGITVFKSLTNNAFNKGDKCPCGNYDVIIIVADFTPYIFIWVLDSVRQIQFKP